MTRFYFTLNDGPRLAGEFASSVYRTVAMAVPALYGDDQYPMTVCIWHEAVMPFYGPYTFYFPDAHSAPICTGTGKA